MNALQPSLEAPPNNLAGQTTVDAIGPTLPPGAADPTPVRQTPGLLCRFVERFVPTYDDTGARDPFIRRNFDKLQRQLGDVQDWIGGHGIIPRRPPPQEHLDAVTPIAHTHWDREWHQPLRVFLKRLGVLMPTVLDLAENDPAFKMEIDGQVAPVYDWLETVPPDQREAALQRVRRQVSLGRLVVGPLYTAGDFNLSSGETTIRNFALGVSQGEALGNAGQERVGKFVDQFGLPATLPKIIALFGITKIVAERGKPPDIPRRILWEADDGSQVEVFFMTDGNGYFRKNQSPDAMRHTARRAAGEPTVFMAGYDHSIPDAGLTERIRQAGIRPLSTFSEFFQRLGRLTDPYVYRGEMRSAGEWLLLPNTASNMVGTKRLFAQSERLLERYAEVFASVGLAPDSAQELDTAWLNQIHNQAHDSKNMSVIDEVAKEVESRAHETIAIAGDIVERGLATLAGSMRQPGNYLWNPSNFARDLRWTDEQGAAHVARQVPPLGWGIATPAEPAEQANIPALPAIRFSDQIDRGDTYTFDPRRRPEAVDIPMSVSVVPGEKFTRLHVAWPNTQDNHRTRILIKLPEKADHSIADVPFGTVTRPATPVVVQGRDRANGHPAPKFIIAGGLAVLVDRVAEYELLPETNELAITLLRAHGALSVMSPKFRQGPAGPRIRTNRTQVRGDVSWDLAVMPWKESDGLPFNEWEEFMLPPARFQSSGGGTLPPTGSLVRDMPEGVLSAVLPAPDHPNHVLVRTFSPQAPHTIQQTLRPYSWM